MKTQKGFYVSLALGCLALFGIGTAYYNTQMKSLSESTPNPIVADDGTTEDKVVKNTPDISELEPDIELDYPLEITDQLAVEEKKDFADAKKEIVQTADNSAAKPEDPEEEANTAVGSFEAGNSVSLSFKEEDGLAWPLQGEVLLPYSGESVVYFSTLNQYRCNQALMLKAEAGTEVRAAARCYVTEVQESDETGMTVSTSIGDEYEVIYGQLKDLAVEKGDVLEEGDLIGVVSEPTLYYTKEGANLWLQVKENDETVDPMLLLR